MVFQKLQKSLALAVAASLVTTGASTMDYTQVHAADRKNAKNTSTEDISSDGQGVFKVTMDDTGYITADNDYAADVNTPFSWDNANVYFVLTDRFYNGDSSNDHSYGRSATTANVPAVYKDTFETVAGSYAQSGEKNASGYESRVGTFHGGDLKGMTQKIEEGYFDALGTNAIWISAPYEQIHGAVTGKGFKHYAYHGYYALDYSNVDANMGTAEDLKEFVTTAHEHGIRVIFDIVMNHAGYADPYTIAEYYGADASVLNSSWRDIYYGTDESSYKWYMDYSEYGQSGGKGSFNSSGWTDIFWTNSWIRNVEKNDDGSSRFAGCGGAESGSDTELCSSGLPDFKTESSSEVGLPDILKKKWTKEGVLSEKQSQIDSMFKRTGLQKNVTGYLVGWLSEWVKDYGIDGFRCDTAKHVGKSEWKKLYTACNAALKQWRKDNSSEPGAQWNDEFWMTGECWDWSSLSADSYFTEGGFTSMINFGYQGSENATGSSLDGTFSRYANAINSSDNFNVLSYISSHDKGLGARSANAGTALLLNPGGVQTFYGDESGRQAGSGADYEPARSHMNWSSTNESILSNWQKVGRFRRNHISVGAGQHTKIADSPYTFSRTYTGKATVGAEAKTDYEDKVVVSLPGSAGTYEVSVGDIFADGDTVVDEYTGEEYTVSGGKVSATCDSNGVILLAKPTDTTPKAKVAASVTSGKVSNGTYSDDSIKVKLTVQNVENATYQINDCDAVSFTDEAEVTIGEDTAYDESTEVTVKGTSTIDQSEVSQKYTYKRSAEPTVGEAAQGFYLRMSKAAYEKASGKTDVPKIWIYDDTKAYSGAAWASRDSMTLDDSGKYYVWKDESLTSKVYVIVTDSSETWRSVPDMSNSKFVSGTVELDPSKKYSDSDQLENIVLDTGDPGKVTVNYIDGAGTVLKSIYRVGVVDGDYTVYAPSTLSGKIDGKTYALAEGEKASKTGKFAADETTVTFTYNVQGEAPATAIPTVEPTPVVTATASALPTATAEPTPTVEPTATPVVTAEPTAIPTVEPTATPEVTVEPTTEPTVAPTAVITAEPTPTVEPTATPVVFAVKMSTNPSAKQLAGKTVKIKASAQGAEGACTYKYVVENSAGTVVFKKGYTSAKSCTWKPSKAGTYVISVYAKDKETGAVDSVEKTFKVSSASLVLKKLSAVNLGKYKVKLTATTTGGKGTVKYKFTYKFNGKTKVLKNYSKTKSFKQKFKKAGTYKFTVYVKDSTGKVKKKTISFKVKK